MATFGQYVSPNNGPGPIKAGDLLTIVGDGATGQVFVRGPTGYQFQVSAVAVTSGALGNPNRETPMLLLAGPISPGTHRDRARFDVERPPSAMR